MRLPLLAALAALTFCGCMHQSTNTRAEDSATGGTSNATTSAQKAALEQAKEQEIAQESPLQGSDVTAKERRDRMGAPTVYDGEATGGSGTDTTVTTGDGQKWDVQEEPGSDREPRSNDTKQDATLTKGQSDTEPQP
ncbi:hypothetical protein JY651_46455 [Pyxidicoccus parkwayensis]|uniref:Lipoprotein n=1 Tax=Pyxidicoccus parkwayensis TaxID=2813578 RepID=A0ABX7NUC2_9BACT|nr:hypothetical protein [Pyxidicoccus parkwaysis]QSQ22482.1 hypothetical protein JY651_46455 [Pyxidicoccus parkwaysis]